MTLYKANIEMCLNFERAQTSKYKNVTNNGIDIRAEIEFRAIHEIDIRLQYDYI